MQNRQESLDVASPGQLWFPSLDSASSDSYIVFRKSAYRLRMTVPNLSTGALLWGLQCCVFSTVERRFFFLCIDHVHSFWETQTTKSRKVSWRVFSKRQPGPSSSRIPDRPNLNFDRSRMVLRQECFGIQSSPQWVQKTNWQAVRETQLEKASTPEHEKKNQWTWLRSPPRSMQNHEADPKQQCDRDANDATKSFDSESYDFDTVWPGP